MPTHARGGHPVKVAAPACQELYRAACRDLARHVWVPAARVDQLVQLELKQDGSSLAKAVAIGAAVGAGTFLGILLILAASWD